MTMETSQMMVAIPPINPWWWLGGGGSYLLGQRNDLVMTWMGTSRVEARIMKRSRRNSKNGCWTSCTLSSLAQLTGLCSPNGDNRIIMISPQVRRLTMVTSYDSGDDPPISSMAPKSTSHGGRVCWGNHRTSTGGYVGDDDDHDDHGWWLQRCFYCQQIVVILMKDNTKK